MSQSIRRKSDQHPAVRSFHRTLDEVDKGQRPELVALNRRLDQRLEHLRAEAPAVDPRREEDGEAIDVEVVELAEDLDLEPADALDEIAAPTSPARPRPA